MRIHTLLLLLFLANSLYCMNESLDSSRPQDSSAVFMYNPHSQLDRWRKSFQNIKTEKDLQDILESNKDIKIMGSVENNHHNYVCLHFAMEMITGSVLLAQKKAIQELKKKTLIGNIFSFKQIVIKMAI